ncbi:MAG: Fic family protein [Methylococcales bacterium]|nr:Fic family protein [Methylococcales bacterium]
MESHPCTIKSISDIHRLFCEKLPDELLWVENNDTGEKIHIKPGALRNRDVKVGNHVAISPGALPRFLQRFEDSYASLGKSESILACAAAHHCLTWIHPFLDGNGRVARLMSHALMLRALNTGPVWSISRGLARNVVEYKEHLVSCDRSRRNELDGRGHLSEEALSDFTRFFLKACIDQVDFMESLVQPERLRTRILLWAEEEIRTNALPGKAGKILEALLYRGELSRGDVPAILDSGDRHARRITSDLIGRGILISDSSRAPLRLAFPANLAHRWMPGLFPER